MILLCVTYQFYFPISSWFGLLQAWEHKSVLETLLSGMWVMHPQMLLGVTSKFLVSCHTVLQPHCHLTLPPVKCRIKAILHPCQHLLLPRIVVGFFFFFKKIVDTLVGVTSIPLWFDLYFLNN